MSRSLNKAMLIGNLGADPEIRTTSGGARVAQLSVATNRRWQDASGQEQEKTEWHRVVVWDSRTGKLLDNIERYYRKGNQVYVEGEIQYRSYQDKDGVTKYSTEIRADQLFLLGGRDGGGAAGDGAPASRERAGARRGGGRAEYEDFQAPALEEDDDLPF